MSKFFSLTMASIISICSFVHAGSQEAERDRSNQYDCCCWDRNDSVSPNRFWYTVVSTGYSWPMKSNIKAPFPAWADSVQGYNQQLTSAPFFTLGFGRKFWNILYSEIDYTSYSTMLYQMYQTTATYYESLNTSAFTRFFNLDSQNVIWNLLFYPGRCFDVNFWDARFSLFFGGGIGVSVNQVSNFHTIVFDITSKTGSTAVIGIPYSNTSFAADAIAGIRIEPSSMMSFDIFYKYYYGGNFYSSSPYTINTFEQTGIQVSSANWKGVLQTNEVVIAINLCF